MPAPSLLVVKNGLEDAGARGGVHALTLVAHRELGPALATRACTAVVTRIVPPCGIGVARVDAEIEEHVLELRRVRVDRARGRVELGVDVDVLADDAAQRAGRAQDGLVQVAVAALRGASTHEREQPRSQPRGTLGGEQDLLGVQALGRARVEVREQALAAHPDHLQHVVEVVRHAAGQPAEGLEALCQAHALVDGLALGREAPVLAREQALQRRRPSRTGAA